MRRSGVTLLVIVGAICTGCSERKPIDMHVPNPWLGPMRVAVAPALNFSGSADLDTYAVADLMASELSQVRGFEVLPVSRTLAVLARQGVGGIDSPEHALEIRNVLGADAILVFAITEYNPYEPPIIGIAAQLYGAPPSARYAGIDPVRIARSPGPVSGSVHRPASAPLAQVTGVWNAAHEPIIREVKAFARSRDGGESPYGWRKYIVSQESYLRFTLHAAIKVLVQHGVAGPPSESTVQVG